MADKEAKISIKKLCVQYEQDGQVAEVLKNVSLKVQDREFVSIIGPSGCGKSTLLKTLSGLIPLTAPMTTGEILIDGKAIRGIPEKVGFVFQNDALLPWKNVIDNIRLPLDLQGMPKAKQMERARSLISSVGLTGFEDYTINRLSGGMRKRVALARTFAHDPEIFLMDEPFGPLDAQTRVHIGEDFLSLWDRLGKSVVFVTHDIEEAIALSDRVVVMSPRPSMVREEFVVNLGRPRPFYLSRFEPEFKKLQKAIWYSLSEMDGF